jgi:hypothetical protein
MATGEVRLGDRTPINHDTLDQEQAAVHGQPRITVGHIDLRDSVGVSTSHPPRRSHSDQAATPSTTSVVTTPSSPRADRGLVVPDQLGRRRPECGEHNLLPITRCTNVSEHYN